MCSANGDVRFGPIADIGRIYSSAGNGGRRTRQNNPDFREFAGLRIDLDRAAVLLDDDVVTNRKAEASTFSGWLSREEWIEHLLLYVGRNTAAVVVDPDFNAVA
jgi:hypothetical protein